MQGSSIVPLLKGKKPKDWRKSLYYQYYEYPGGHSVRRHYGVRTNRYKLIHFYMLDGWELYDLKEDPNELNSLYGKKGYEKITSELKKELNRLRELYQVPEDTRPLVRTPREPRKKKRDNHEFRRSIAKAKEKSFSVTLPPTSWVLSERVTRL